MSRTGSNIYKRKDGRYEGRILMEQTVSHPKRYAYVYARTLREVKQKMDRIRAEQRVPNTSSQLLLKDAAAEWFAAHQGHWKPATYDNYWRIWNKYINPHLGNAKIAEIKEEQLSFFCFHLVSSSGKSNLSNGYRKYIGSVLLRILTYANQMYGLKATIPRLPTLYQSPKVFSLPNMADLDGLTRYLSQNLSDNTCLGILLARYTGIRIGELCALRWEDLDLEKGTVTIQRNMQRVKNYSGESQTRISIQSPKTSTSHRIIPLPDFLIRQLLPYQRSSNQYLITGRKCPWAEVRTVQYRFSSILKKCQIEPFPFHTLRHVFASQCICRGCDLKSLSEILGHSNVQITMNIYVHSNLEHKKMLMNQVWDTIEK